MAVRDEGHRKAVGHEVGPRLAWKDILGHLPAIVVVAGLVMYGYLSVCYDRFYGSLGVDPNDVGLNYTGTLARSSGFALVVVGATLFVYTAFGLPRRDVLFGLPSRHGRGRTFGSSVFIVFMLWLAYLLPPLLLTTPFVYAGEAAEAVKAGKAVSSIRTPWYIPAVRFGVNVPLLAVHADPTTVEPAGKPGESPATERLRGRRLLYLGQSGGTVVLYDAAAQQAVYVPASSIILHVTNCAPEAPPNSACR